MIRAKTLVVFALLVSTQMIWSATADAGPLMDWIRNRQVRRAAASQPCAQPCAQPTGSCTTTCTQTCQRVVVNYVPCTAYRTSWERVPVTTYRQTSSTDPCTGCTVTCNRPCTTYTYRMKQVPFTTYRPVYRTETYQVPVTYTTPAPASSGGCGLFSGCGLFGNSAPATTVQSVPVQAVPMAPSGCNSCGVPVAAPVVQSPTPTYYESNPGTITTTPSTMVPADQIPTLASPQNMQKPIVVEGTSSTTTWPTQIENQSTQYMPIPDPIPSNRWNENGVPALVNPFNKSASAPSVQRWDYSPVKLASYESPLKVPVALQDRDQAAEYVGTISRSPSQPTTQQRVNEGWRND